MYDVIHSFSSFKYTSFSLGPKKDGFPVGNIGRPCSSTFHNSIGFDHSIYLMDSLYLSIGTSLRTINWKYWTLRCPTSAFFPSLMYPLRKLLMSYTLSISVGGKTHFSSIVRYVSIISAKEYMSLLFKLEDILLYVPSMSS
jgi:hypothetical protein